MYADIVATMVKTVCPLAYEAFEDYSLNSLYLSGPEVQVLADVLCDMTDDVDSLVKRGLSKREAQELISKLKHMRNTK